ncbi:MAG TPA: hypothetical protein VNW46_07900 [Gemmatimonadaceae bacterium]|nr:hypothetical protein [Gemmatimonadaceae bacterium]
MSARVLPPFQGQVVFDVNQPAYVAVFDVRPFIGIEMLYPGPNDPGRAIGGVQAAPIYYLTQATEERQAQSTPFVGGGEEYLYLVASRTPLDLGEFADHPIALSEAAHVALKGLPPASQIDSLMLRVVKPLYDVDWDSDVLILSPGPDSATGNLRIIACGGVDVSVPAGYPFKACPHQDRLVPTVATSAATHASLQQGLEMHYAPGVTRGAAGAQTPATKGHMTAGEQQAEIDRMGVKRSSTPAHVVTSHTPTVMSSSGGTAVSSNGGATTVTGGGKP